MGVMMREGGRSDISPFSQLKKFRSGIGTGVFFEEGKVKRRERIFPGWYSGTPLYKSEGGGL